ncbi:hypothetical protein CEP51_016509, partial [Fusarium floridanum]
MKAAETFDRFIIDWLSATQGFLHPDLPPSPGRVLRDASSKNPAKRFLSPPMTDQNASPSKWPRPDPDATPLKTYSRRPSHTISLSSCGLSDANSATSESLPKRARSARSGNGSPTKKGISVMLMDGIVTHPSFNGSEPLPAALEEMVEDIREDSMGCDIITAEDKAEIEVRARAGGQRSSLFRKVLRPDPVDMTGKRKTFGRLPPLDSLVEIWEKAQ